MNSYFRLLLLLSFLFTPACLPTNSPAPSPDFPQSPTPSPGPAASPTPVSIPDRMQRGVNLGNALEAPMEGEWGMVIQEEYFDLVKEAGFDFVRIPIRWSAHADEGHPYTINPAFTARVDQVVGWGLQRDLVVIINIHHYDPNSAAIAANPERFIEIWRQLAQHYREDPPELVFELLNEPDNTITVQQWNDILARAIAVIRESNPTREIVVGGIDWNAYNRLGTLALPEDDPHLIATFHYYQPFEFTHQGAEWVSGSEPWLGREWLGTEAEKKQIQSNFGAVARWAQEKNLPVLLGEFGVYSTADLESRARWTAYVREQSEFHNFSWAYWEFGAGFGVYDRSKREWNQALKEALLP